MSEYPYRDRLHLYNDMKGMNEDDYEYVRRLLIKHDEAHTVNSNGIFFDLERVSVPMIRDLILYFRYIKPMVEG